MSALLDLPATLPRDLGVDGTRLAVQTDGLCKSYLYLEDAALRDVALQVPAGAFYLLVGPNGSGKSTTLRILLHIERATSGAAWVFGVDTALAPPLVRAQVGYVPEVTEVAHPHLKVGQLLQYHAAFYEQWDWRYARRLCDRLAVRVEAPWKNLSKGHARRVLLVMALAHRPPLLLFDEPTDGFDPVMREEVLGLLVEHVSEAPTTIVWCTHHVHEVDRLADHVGVLRGGRLLLQAEREVLRRGLLRYRLELPAGWEAPPQVLRATVRRSSAGREGVWTTWGEQDRVVAALATSGAVVREVSPLTLEEATLALVTGGKDWW